LKLTVYSLPKESIVDVYGEVSPVEAKVESCTQKNVEISVERFYCVSASAPVLPFQIDDAGRRVTDEDDASVIRVGQDVRLDHRVIDLRVPTNCAIFRIKSGVACLFREFFNKIDFVEIHTPKLIGAASEGGSSVFRVDYFERMS
jgi:aspartyl-tRNA synthetase